MAQNRDKKGRFEKTYSEEYVDAVLKYIQEFETEHSHSHPSILGFSRVIGVSRRNLYAWAEVEDDFSDVLDLLRDAAEHVLLGKGLKKENDSGITKLALGKYGYHDKQEITGADGKAFIPEPLTKEQAKAISENLEQEY